MSICQRAREVGTGSVTSGELLGLDDNGIIEITESYSHPSNLQDESEIVEYQSDMVKLLKEANVDQTPVGCYQCSSLEGWLTPSFIENQSLYQSNIPNSIILVVDILRSSRGPPCVKAFRLKDEFVTLFREKRGRQPNMCLNTEIFVEFPVSLKFSSLDLIFLMQTERLFSMPNLSAPRIPEIEEFLLRIQGNAILSSTEDVLVEAGRLQHHLRNTVKQNQANNSQFLRLV